MIISIYTRLCIRITEYNGNTSGSTSASWHMIPFTALSHLGLDYLHTFIIRGAIGKAFIIPRFLYPCLHNEGFVLVCCYQWKEREDRTCTFYKGSILVAWTVLKWSGHDAEVEKAWLMSANKSELFECIQWHLLHNETLESLSNLFLHEKHVESVSLEHGRA